MPALFATARFLRRRCLALALVLGTAGLAGCSATRPVYNQPLPAKAAAETAEGGYRLSNVPASGRNSNELLVVASFSGGGARAATLAYAVLDAMRQVPIDLGDGRGPRSLFDELDVISAVSGGSWPAAYLAQHGDAMFPAFEQQVLRRDLQGDFVHELLAPAQWGWLFSPTYGRGDLFAEFMDREVFHGATYADVLARGQRPWVTLNATDMSLGARFEFKQEQFDLMCSDLGSVKLATAVAASSAVPIALSPITLRNYAGHCPQPPQLDLYGLFGERRRAQYYQQSTSYQDGKARPYIHLLDGGLADNLAIRAMLEATMAAGGLRAVMAQAGILGVRWLVCIVVNAEGHAGLEADQSELVPSVLRVTQAVADIPLGRHSNDSLELLREAVARWPQEAAGPNADPNAPPPLKTYLIEVSLEALEAASGESVGSSPLAGLSNSLSLRTLPTALSLPPAAVDQVLEAGHTLFRQSPELQRLLKDVGSEARR